MTDQQKTLIHRVHGFASDAKDYARVFEALQEQEALVLDLERRLESARNELFVRRGQIELRKSALAMCLPELP
jgi:hypothetical protein